MIEVPLRFLSQTVRAALLILVAFDRIVVSSLQILPASYAPVLEIPDSAFLLLFRLFPLSLDFCFPLLVGLVQFLFNLLVCLSLPFLVFFLFFVELFPPSLKYF